ncbi:hypothetical protein JXA85_02785 [Candidatus Woesearchaeota archaeon]|nr:hypothetical protein [Candidatus Woesearchaeota archaeon]
MGIFGKKKEEQPVDEDKQFEETTPQEAKPVSANVEAEIIKIKAQLDSFGEVRKATTDRLTRITEQIGELRGMIMDTNKALTQMEVKITKAVDLVDSVQPDKLMIEVKRQDAKISGLTGKIESNKSLAESFLEQIKEMRNKVNTFQGIEQVIKLNDDVKKELQSIQKVKTEAERHADKTETIFVEIQKKVTDLDTTLATVKELEKGFNKIVGDFDVLKVGVAGKADRKEIENFFSKFNKFEAEYGKLVKMLSEKVDFMKKDLVEKMESKLKRAEEIEKVLIELSEKENPELEKNLDRIKEVAEKKNAEKKQNEKKQSFISKFFRKKKEEPTEEEKKEDEDDNLGKGDDKPVEEEKKEDEKKEE